MPSRISLLMPPLAVLWLGLASPARAQNAAFSSRALAPDPGWLAQEGARAATGDEVASASGNPASVAGLTATHAAFSHLSWAGGVAREWGGAAFVLRPGAVLAADAGVLHTQALTGYDAGGNENGTFQPMEWNAGAALSVAAGAWQGGFGARLFRLQQVGAALAGVGFSAGILRAQGAWRIGIAATDFGPPAQADGARYRLPTVLRGGIERTLASDRWLVALAVEDRGGGDRHASLGISARPVRWFEILGGVSSGSGLSGQAQNGSGSSLPWSTGVRISHKSFLISYAYHPAGLLGPTHQFGLGVPLGRPRSAWREETQPSSTQPAAGRSGATVSANDGPAADRAPAESSPVAPAGGSASDEQPMGVWGGRYRRAEDAQAEIRILDRAGCAGARLVPVPDGTTRVLAGACANADEARALEKRLRKRAILVTIEPLPSRENP